MTIFGNSVFQMCATGAIGLAIGLAKGVGKPFFDQSSEPCSKPYGKHPLIHLHEQAESSDFLSDEQIYESLKILNPTVCSELIGKVHQLSHGQVQNGASGRNILQSIREIVSRQLSCLSDTQKNQVYGSIYQIEKVERQLETNDPEYGKNHALDNIPRLIRALGRQGHHLFLKPESTPIYEGFEPPRLETRSNCFDLGKPSPNRGKISYINGIGTTFERARYDAYRLSDSVAQGKNLECVYNATHEAYGSKVCESILGQGGISTTPVRLLLEQWQDFFNSVPLGECYLQICYSQGAIHVKNALDALPPELRERICVIALAPAAFIPYCKGCQVIHFFKASDPIPTSLATGNKRVVDASWDKAVVQVPTEGEETYNPHDPFSPNYLSAFRGQVQHYLQHNRLDLPT